MPRMCREGLWKQTVSVSDNIPLAWTNTIEKHVIGSQILWKPVGIGYSIYIVTCSEKNNQHLTYINEFVNRCIQIHLACLTKIQLVNRHIQMQHTVETRTTSLCLFWLITTRCTSRHRTKYCYFYIS